jgi:hypothetical protein
MIPVKDADINALLSLARNEDGFRALMRTLKAHLDVLEQDLNTSARAALFHDAARAGALARSGHVAAISEVLELLERQVEIGR